MKHFRIEATWSSGNSMVTFAEAKNDSQACKIAKEKVAGMPSSYGKLVELIVNEVSEVGAEECSCRAMDF